jgi:hypothetical protein
MPKPKSGGYVHRQAVSEAKACNQRAGQAIQDVLTGKVEGKSALIRLGQAQGALLEQRGALDTLEELARQKGEAQESGHDSQAT